MSRKVKFTTFYIPGIHKDLTFKDKLDNIPDLDFSEEDKEIGQEDNPIEGGVHYDAWTHNKSYKQLIDKVGINWKSVTELMNFYEWGSNDVEMCEQNLTSHSCNRKEAQVIFNFFYWCLSEAEVWRLWSEEICSVRKEIRNFKRCLKLRKLSNKKYLGKSKMLKKIHHDFIKNLVSTYGSTIPTASIICNNLKDNFEELENVSLSTVTRNMKNDWKLKYK